MKFAKWLYLFAGTYGIVALLPQYFLEDMTGRLNPPALTHPEFYYGFLGVAVAWQIAFLIIARDPARYRMIMIPGIAEKVLFGVAVIALFLAGRVGGAMLGAGVIDLMWAALFVVAFKRTAETAELSGARCGVTANRRQIVISEFTEIHFRFSVSLWRLP